jgi:hypothetical protein
MTLMHMPFFKVEIHLEMERSGATIAWNHFNKERDLLAVADNKQYVS